MDLTVAVNEQSGIIDRIFPSTVDVMMPFLERLSEDVIGEYIMPLLDEAHDRDIESYLKSVAELYVHVVQFSKSIKPAKGSEKDFPVEMMKLVIRIFEPHVDLYLQEELDHFKRLCEEEVESWEKKVHSNILHGSITNLAKLFSRLVQNMLLPSHSI